LSLRGTGFAALVLSIGLTACSKEPDARRDLTQHEKDSILGASQIPGAKAVKRSLTSADSANARQARLDSAEREP
jgi:hypothetical protein